MGPVRFGLIGYGAWGSHHARAIASAEGAELAAIAARSPAARADHPGAAIHADYREMLARDDLDVVDVVVPSDLHHEIGLAVLESGKHLLMEKPMALTIEHCDEMLALARSRGKLLIMVHELRLSSLWGRVKAMIDAGDVGDPQYALIELWRRPYRQGSGGWRYQIDRVGDWILEEPIHFFDLARWYFAKAGEPVSVYARANSRQPGHPELQDNFGAVVNFPGGAYAVIAHTLSAFEHHQTVKLTGTRGALWARWRGAQDRDRDPASSLIYFDGAASREISVPAPSGEIFELEEQIARVTRAVRHGEPVPADGEDGRRAVMLCLAAQRSVGTAKVASLHSNGI